MQREKGGSMKISVCKKHHETWKKWMNLGEYTGCHQRADRSFFYHGYQFPVCARCTGVIIGYLIAIPSYLLFGFQKELSMAGAMVMFTDWALQQAKIKESTNRRRFFTGIAGGFAIMSIQIKIFSWMKNKLFS